MRTVRCNIFETNSSSTHSVVLRPITVDNVKSIGDGSLVLSEFPFDEAKKMLVLKNNPEFAFGTYYTFYDKLNYIVYLLLYRKSDELLKDWDWDDKRFTVKKGNEVLNSYYKDFIDRIAEYVSKSCNIDCRTIGFACQSGKGGRVCHFNFDHEVLSDTENEDLSLNEDLIKIITTEGLAIKYEFA